VAVDGAVEGELLSLQEAAERLRVHYMTAYRWVRRGELAAFKAGGRLRVRASDIERFVADREVEVGLPSTRTRRTDWPVHVRRLHRLLVDGKATDAGRLVRKVVADGAPAGDVYLHLLTPALHAVGEDWAAGRASVAVEHRATVITAQIMARLAHLFRRRGPSRATAVTVTPPGEQHALGAAMTADFLRGAGCEVHHLGADVPLDDLRLFVSAVRADVVCVSLTQPRSREELSGLVAACDPAPVVMGGQAADPALVEAAGARCVPDLAALAVALEDVVVDSATV
jgi:excisionase family DNA binding protein